MSLESSLLTVLATDAPLAALLAIGTSPETYRIYHELRADNALPALVFSRDSTSRQLTLDGPSDLTTVRLGIDCWAADAVAVRDLGAKLKAALDGVTGTFGTTTIRIAYYDGELDLGDFEGDRRDKRISYDFVFILNE